LPVERATQSASTRTRCDFTGSGLQRRATHSSDGTADPADRSPAQTTFHHTRQNRFAGGRIDQTATERPNLGTANDTCANRASSNRISGSSTNQCIN
jgi:hypothetical protein